jgi:hypothetical protein
MKFHSTDLQNNEKILEIENDEKEMDDGLNIRKTGPRGGPFSLCLTHKGGLYPSSGDINRLMMMYKCKQIELHCP